MVSDTKGISQKSRLALTLIAFFLGWLGIHRFYTGKVGTGIIMFILYVIGMATVWLIFGLIPLVIICIWVLIDFIMAIAGIFSDGDGNIIKRW